MKKYFGYYEDMLDYILLKLETEDNITILCDIDIKNDIKDEIEYGKYKEFRLYENNKNDIYYISKFMYGKDDYLYIESAMRDGKMLRHECNLLLIVDDICKDYKLNVDCEEIEELLFEEDKIYDDSKLAELELIDEYIDFILDESCEDCISEKITDLAYIFKEIGRQDMKDLFREFIEETARILPLL